MRDFKARSTLAALSCFVWTERRQKRKNAAGAVPSFQISLTKITALTKPQAKKRAEHTSPALVLPVRNWGKNPQIHKEGY
ncbi:hypothetical protein [uncultured Cohaesibacter sp.]|uniref:hypothetical protein n=1 Tax=uncultured Cohaesibacter sp. TaxID=1002546 RepID=UPI00293054B7|nr:hypothetical protein [uncultured Cohaesibacter sp.]